MTVIPSRGRRRFGPLALLVAVLLGLPLVGLASASPSTAQVVSPAVAGTSPLTGPWGRYLVPTDDAYHAYSTATGTDKALLAKIALRARVRWFGEWIPQRDVTSKIQHYIQVEQAGDPQRLVQLAIFRLWPNGGEPGKLRPLTLADQRAYRSWIRTAAAAIGSSRTALVLEPDLPVALTGWQPAVRLALTRYAARTFAALPRTSVYVDAGDADWLRVDQAVSMLRSAGVEYTRGFSLGATHYWSLEAQDSYGRAVVAGLTAAGIPDRHFVIDTADNGRPFTWPEYWAAHPHGDFDTAETCATTADVQCVTLGHWPTWRVIDPAHVDAYLWFGRPWLYKQASPWQLDRALAIARSTPF